MYVIVDQGDQIGQNFAIWAIFKVSGKFFGGENVFCSEGV